MKIGGQKPFKGLSCRIIIISLIFILSGCAAIGSITRKKDYRFETTGLFIKPCQKNKSCDENETDLQRMITVFNSVKESDDEKGILGDSVDDVKRKGFNIYIDDKEKIQRPATEILYGADALAAAGIPLNPPMLNTPVEIETYKKYMKSHFAWTFQETNIQGVSDRIYINTKNAAMRGPSYKFVIVFKDNRVFRRIIKGGSQNTATKQKAFLLGPGGFLGDILSGGVNRGVNMIK